jgi:uncharacterized protein YkwD
LAAFLESKERLSQDISTRPPTTLPPRRRGLSVIRLFPVIVAVAVIALAALSLSCMWQQRMQEDLATGVNQIRAEHGLGTLVVDPQLSAIAQHRAQDMASKNYFSHDPPDGCPIRCLMERAGIAPFWAGEVIAWNNTTADQAANMSMDMWRNSPEHLAVITNGCFTRMGTGAAFGANGDLYHVAVFEGRAPGC